MKWWSRLLEYARAGVWVPTDEVRERVVYSIPLPPGRVVVVRERERQHFGRWGKWKWRAERRWVTVEERKVNREHN